MAGRPEKFTISYFPHYVRDSKTMFIIENKFGAEGYMFWFKLLELLCNSKNLYFDCNEDDNFEYLCAKIKVSATKATKILNNLSALNKIDKELWENKIIWCQDLVDNVSDVFKRRKSDIPERPSIIANVSLINESNNSINVNNNLINESKKPISAPQSKLNKINNIINNINSPKNSKEFSDDSDEITLSKLLFTKIKERDQKCKEPDYQKWGVHIGRLIRLDKRSPETIKKVIEWCQQDVFWQNNILSTEKLREQFTQLFLKMNKGGGSSVNTGGNTKRFSNERDYGEEEHRKIAENFYA